MPPLMQRRLSHLGARARVSVTRRIGRGTTARELDMGQLTRARSLAHNPGCCVPEDRGLRASDRRVRGMALGKVADSLPER